MTTESDAALSTPDDSAEPAPPPMPDFVTTADWHSRPDWTLQQLAESNFPVSVMLFLPWGAVTGITVLGEQFFNHGADTLIKATETMDIAENAEWVATNVIRSNASAYGLHEPEDLIHQAHCVTRHLHLKKVTCILNGEPLALPYLRVQLSHVTAWTYAYSLDESE